MYYIATSAILNLTIEWFVLYFKAILSLFFQNYSPIFLFPIFQHGQAEGTKN